MKKMVGALWLIICLTGNVQAQRPVYHPCFLMDSVDKHLMFIQQNVKRVFVDSFDCRQTLLDSITQKYLRSNDKKYLDALNYIRLIGAEKVENLYTDVVTRLFQSNFAGFIDKLYLARGQYEPLEKEVVTAMNMIVDGRPLKQKYLGLLNVEISKATDAKNTAKLYYLNRLKKRIEEDIH